MHHPTDRIAHTTTFVIPVVELHIRKEDNTSNRTPPVLQGARCSSVWKERSLMVRWVVGSILHGEPTELFLVPASAPRLAVVCAILSVGWCI